MAGLEILIADHGELIGGGKREERSRGNVLLAVARREGTMM
jgi:hypothetical protein